MVRAMRLSIEAIDMLVSAIRQAEGPLQKVEAGLLAWRARATWPAASSISSASPRVLQKMIVVRFFAISSIT